jgi:hypothetical protein
MPPKAKPVLTSLLDETQEEKEAKAKAAKKNEVAAAQSGGMGQEMKERQKRAPKQAGTKKGKSLSTWTEKYIDNLNYRKNIYKNYISELESIRDNEKSKTEKEKAKELLDNFEQNK